MPDSLRILADENMPFADVAFATIGEVRLMGGRSMTAADAADADILAIRSVTKTNADLLEGSKVGFVGTATIGEDHVDKGWLAANNIGFSSAPGCNANSVSEYVLAIILEMAAAKGFDPRGMKLGIIGVGNVGSRVAVKAEAIGMQVILNDPPLKDATGDEKYRPLDEVFDADIITTHVPLEKETDYPTYHLVDQDFLKKMSESKGYINASRGKVVDEQALKQRIKAGKLLFTALDVWGTEPAIDTELLDMVDIATPHIAGYSFEGKVNGTSIIYEAACRHFGREPSWKRESVLGEPETHKLDTNGDWLTVFRAAVAGNYDIWVDDKALREAGTSHDVAGAFDTLRKTYWKRREFTNTILKISADTDPQIIDTLKTLLFFIE